MNHFIIQIKQISSKNATQCTKNILDIFRFEINKQTFCQYQSGLIRVNCHNLNQILGQEFCFSDILCKKLVFVSVNVLIMDHQVLIFSQWAYHIHQMLMLFYDLDLLRYNFQVINLNVSDFILKRLEILVSVHDFLNPKCCCVIACTQTQYIHS